MKYEEMAFNEVVEHINSELLKNRTMKDIEENDFGENKGVIQKRLNRKGYVRVNNKFVPAKEGNTTNKATKIIQHKNTNTTKSTTEKLQNKMSNKQGNKVFSNDEIEKLNKLLKLDIDILNNMIMDYTTKNNTSSSIDIKDNATVVTSIRVNKELYLKIKDYSKKESIKLQDIFNQMMIKYISDNIK